MDKEIGPKKVFLDALGQSLVEIPGQTMQLVSEGVKELCIACR